MDENITFKVNYYRDSGFDEESIRAATEDMKNGVDIEIVECYMNANIPREQRLELANLFRQGMPLELGTRLAGLGKSQLDEVLIHAKERIPFEAIRSIIMQYTSAHQIKKAFEVYIEKAKERAKEFSLEDNSTKVDSNKSVESETVEEPAVETEVEPETSSVSFAEVDNLDNTLSESNLAYLDKSAGEDSSDSLANADLKQDIKSVLLYMDQLLENLPEEKIVEFAKSDEFVTYKKLFSELGLS